MFSSLGTSDSRESKAKLVLNINTTLSLAHDKSFADVLYDIAQEIRTSIGAHQSAVSFIPDGDFQRAVHTHSFSSKYEKYNSYDVMPTGKGIWRLVIDQRKSVRFTEEELYSHPMFKRFSELKDARGLEHPPMPGWLASPVKRPNGEVVGVLQLSDRFEGDFDEHDQEYLEGMAKLTSIIFELQYVNHDLAEKTKQAELAERKLRRAVSSLQRQNQEIEQFVYVASHDLQEPLRTIIDLSEKLKKDYADTLDAKGNKLLSFVSDSSNRMRNLVKGLLEYGRIGKNKQLKSVDCIKLVKAVKKDMKTSIEEVDGELIINDLPIINAYETELRVLFQNLIANAIKFRRKDVPPRVVVSAKPNNGWTFSIEDNGIGIDKQYQDQIFVIFQRLYNQSEYPGTGIGLSHCKKIVELHGGNIWVESTPNEGSTFFFNIPNL
ncbi:ATP-binding protein [Roseivirga sp. UBA1976]|uniref:sensor histidine kinase n=1 Tax=Roseivirga sp. UBA1976 TaxID=1947386 RepID=UPI00257F8FE5|nr:ATP-binding protein [Roseivirga sp. UBA1976]MEC7756088.1 ATP-binding protein [Bacteroidota bacterium]|tara:strand:- start:1043 stop:2347 length:1305 start_codon:yes stop_codon:yes gene_type:complete